MHVCLPSTPPAIPPTANGAAGKLNTEEVVVGVREHGHSAKRRRLDVASSAIPGLNASLPDTDPHTEIPVPGPDTTDTPTLSESAHQNPSLIFWIFVSWKVVFSTSF
ncbi:hypothetical protein L208DRAFT_1395846 [Tricholoma matsutake]|nr:hypothetical protein L208DRAFT_1395846 [Tricholoma matsutake 945]